MLGFIAPPPGHFIHTLGYRVLVSRLRHLSSSMNSSTVNVIVVSKPKER